jgi:hypothetical protein
MIRLFLAAALLYAYGHASFDGQRPRQIDPALKGFHREVNETAAGIGRAWTLLDDARSMRYLVPMLRQMNGGA